MGEELLKSALALAAMGARVFPLAPGSKRPAIEGWPEKASGAETDIRRFWSPDRVLIGTVTDKATGTKKPVYSDPDFNVGIATGNGIVGVDIDVKNGKSGEESFAALGLNDNDLDTFIVTTPSGGRHVYFTGPDHRNSADRLGRGLDIRGLGGYLVGPGSVLRNGSGSGVYAVAHNAPLRPLPEPIHLRLEGGRGPPDGRRQDPAVDLDRGDALDLARDFLQRVEPAVQGAGGDHHTFTVAARLRDLGVSEDTAYELMLDWNEGCVPPWDVDDLRTKVENAFRYGENRPGSAHPAAMFEEVSIDPPPVHTLSTRRDAKWFRVGEDDDALASEPWLYYERLPARGVSVLVGPSQAGKTFLELELARSLATGKPFFGTCPDDAGGTVFVFCGAEGSGFGLRSRGLGEHRSLPISAIKAGDLSQRSALGQLLLDIRTESERMELIHGVPLRLVVLETLSASGLIADEGDNAQIARAVRNLETLADQLGVLLMVTHHPPKDGKGARGGGAITANVDYVLEIHRNGTEKLRQLELTKARNAEQRMLGTFSLLEVELGKDSRGRPIKTMTISMGEAITPEIKRSSFAEVFMTAVDWALKEKGGQVDGRMAVEVEDVKPIFVDLKPGSKDRGNVHRAFKGALENAEDLGVIETFVFGGARYLYLKQEQP